MSNLVPVAFDIETTGLGTDATLSVLGLAGEVGARLWLNTADRDADTDELEAALEDRAERPVNLTVRPTERELLDAFTESTRNRLDPDRHYLTAYNGETWNAGFDLPFLRRACVRHDVDWPFPDVAYADVLTAVDRFDTGETRDLAGVHAELVGGEHCDPFSDSEQAVDAHANGDWLDLLLHNLADIIRTRELAVLAERYVPKSDFRMKSLGPPNAV